MGAAHATNYMLYPADHSTMMRKLKSTCRRISQKKPNQKQAAANPSPASPKTNKSPKATPVKYAKKLLLPMPRCSSFGSTTSLLVSSRKPLNDPHYTQWKLEFETSRGVVPQAERPCIHDISEALAGQLTPKGFPSYTEVHKSGHITVLSNSASRTSVQYRLSLRLPMLSCSPRKLKTRQEQTNTNKPMQSQKSQLRKESSNYSSKERKPQILPEMSKRQANAIEQLYQEIKDLDTRLEYYHLYLIAGSVQEDWL